MSRTLGLVVPSLYQGGGVPSVARFLWETAIRSGEWDIKPISLCMASDDLESSSLVKPLSVLRGPQVGRRTWMGRDVPHVGASFGELEFQRYRPRKVLAELVTDCDVIQVVCGSPAWANTVLGLDKPVAVHVATRARVERRQRDANPRSAADWWRKCMTEITDRFDDRALRRADAIQVMNPWMLEYVRELNAERDLDLRYAPPGVDAERFSPVDQRVMGNDPYILCVARLSDPRKKVGLLLEAYSLLPEEIRNAVRLVLAGSSGPGEEFWRRAGALGLRERITFVEKPQSDELVRLYQGASVFALPSDEEGFGVVLLEAMACGVPVVSTRSGGPDGIINDGVEGFLVDLDDAKMMSERLRVLLEDPVLNAAMGQSARKTIEIRYDNRVAGAAFLETWERLLRK